MTLASVVMVIYFSSLAQMLFCDCSVSRMCLSICGLVVFSRHGLELINLVVMEVRLGLTLPFGGTVGVAFFRHS